MMTRAYWIARAEAAETRVARLDRELSEWRSGYRVYPDLAAKLKTAEAEVEELKRDVATYENLLSRRQVNAEAEVARLREALEMIARPTVDTPTGDVARKALASTTPSAPKTSEGGIKPAPRVGLATSAVGGTDQALPPVTGHGSEEPGVSPSAPVAGRSVIDDAPPSKSASLETAANVTREPGATEGGPGADIESPCRDCGVAHGHHLEHVCPRDMRAAVVAEIVAWTKDHSFEFADQVSAAIEAKWGKGETEGGPGACAQHERFTLDVGACGDCERERRARAAVVAEIVAMMRENARRKDSCANGESNSTYRHALLGAASLLRGYANAIEAKWGKGGAER